MRTWNVTATARTTLLKLFALAILLGMPHVAFTETKQSASKPGADAAVKAAKELPLPRPRPTQGATPSAPSDKRATSTPESGAAPTPLPPGATVAALPPLTDLNAVRQAIDLVRKGKHRDANDLTRGMKDPVSAKVVEWFLLRSDDNMVSFDRYASFISNNPDWPSIWFFRRRAEAVLWRERREAATVRAFFRANPPLTAKGKFALARALSAQGERQEAEAIARDAWRNDPFTSDVETAAHDMFEKYLTREDHKIRMDRRLNVEDVEAGLRAANRLGGVDQAIARARAAVIRKESKAAALLDAVPTAARSDPGYIFSRVQLLRRQEKIAEAGALILTASHDPAKIHDADEWWLERRVLVRKLLDIGDAKTAYAVASNAALPNRSNYRVDQPFTAGWVALRFLRNPQQALEHFNKTAVDTNNPIAKARAAYWRGRALEALGRAQEARAQYEAAAQAPAAYYGQIARAKLKLGDIALNPAPALTPEERDKALRNEVVRAVQLLYHVNERDLVAIMAADSGENADDVTKLALIGELTAHYQDGRSMLLLGKAAFGRGLPFEVFAFPTVGMPNYQPIGPPIEPALLYSIARQESGFNPRVISTARALGLMQVTPAAGKYVTGKFKVPYDEKRLLSDTVYNTQIGAAELGDVLKDYRGSYILAFVAYNAGRGRVKDWTARYGDPRDPKVDPLDWVERIPFSETRNYVQRVMENLQVYRVRFGGGSKLMIEADLRRGGSGNIH
jgi:soluble lytic murein transglycosylase